MCCSAMSTLIYLTMVKKQECYLNFLPRQPLPRILVLVEALQEEVKLHLAEMAALHQEIGEVHLARVEHLLLQLLVGQVHGRPEPLPLHQLDDGPVAPLYREVVLQGIEELAVGEGLHQKRDDILPVGGQLRQYLLHCPAFAEI